VTPSLSLKIAISTTWLSLSCTGRSLLTSFEAVSR
jgi:hypothetical protein